MVRYETHTPVFKFLRSTVGNSIEMKVNGSVTPVYFRLTAPAHGHIELFRCNITMVDGGIGYGEFGGLGALLTNGLEVKLFDNTGTAFFDYLDGQTIKGNADFGLLAGVDNLAHPASGDDSFPVRWTLEKSGAPGILYPGWFLQVKVQDNLTALTKFRWFCQGVQF